MAHCLVCGTYAVIHQAHNSTRTQRRTCQLAGSGDVPQVQEVQRRGRGQRWQRALDPCAVQLQLLQHLQGVP